MKYDPKIHHRRSIRLQGYDYSQSGAYFVTIVAQGRASLFGQIENGEMVLNDAGQMIVKWWNELPNKFPQITLGVFVVMPNHFHGIIIIGGIVGGDLRVSPGVTDDKDGGRVGGNLRVPLGNEGATNTGGHVGPPQQPPPQQKPNAPLSQMIQWFKTMTTNEYIRGVKELGWPRFDGKLWQRDYYEHIIRNADEANRIHLYIESNPVHWATDTENQ
ncbi:MAG: transposase [Chloroflexota bacterium]